MNSLLDTLTALGPFGLLFIAALDSAGIPLPMGVDGLLIALAIVSPPQAFLAALLATAGSAAGSALLYQAARKGGEAYLRRRTESARGRKFRGWFHRYGLITVFIPTVVPIIPLPMKVFVLTAGATRVSFRAFLLTIIAGRIPRFFAMAYLGARLGEDSVGWLHQHAWHLALVAVALFLLLFALVKFAGARAAAGAPEARGASGPHIRR